MTTFTRAAFWAGTMAALMLPLCAAAQTAPGTLGTLGTPGTPTTSSTQAPPTGPDSKAAAARDKAKAAARKATAAAGAAGAATAMALALADDDQRKAFGLVHLGEHQCEFKRVVQVLTHPTQEAYVNLHFDKRVVTARPVLSSTGAVRLEDVKGQFTMLQIAFKSMLLDTKNGQRIADECLHDNHHEAKRAAAHAPATPGLGIAAPSAAAPTTPISTR